LNFLLSLLWRITLFYRDSTYILLTRDFVRTQKVHKKIALAIDEC